MCNRIRQVKELRKHNNTWYPAYQEPSDAFVSSAISDMQTLLGLFYAEQRRFYPNSASFSIKINRIAMSDVIVRTDKAVLHYKMYHDTLINELKETAIRVFWILKYKPFMISINGSDFAHGSVNEHLAFYIIRRMVRYYRQTRNMSDVVFREDLRTLFLYMFGHRSFTYDALSLTLESLCAG